MNRAKFKALVHYIIAKSDPATLGAIRLNKILFYIDAFAFQATGQSLTGETYVKRQHGPVPKDILRILGELEDSKAIVIRNRGRVPTARRDYISMVTPNTATLGVEDLEIADFVREDICENHTASSISLLSHTHVWEAANIGETIPLEATLVSAFGEVTREAKKWADSVTKRYEAIHQAA